jgi:Amt family ammonium transporter
MSKLNRLISICMLMFLPVVAQAEGADTGDTAWILTSTALVLFMTLPGLALFYGGLVRAKNVLSVLMQCFVIACVVSVLWVIYGYSIAFGDGGSMNAWIGGLDNAFLANVTRESLSGTLPESVFVMFQMNFLRCCYLVFSGSVLSTSRYVIGYGEEAGWQRRVCSILPVARWCILPPVLLL